MRGEPALSINGELVPHAGPHLSARDRGFLLGDGLFETLRVRRGQVVRWADHLARLRNGAGTLDLPLAWTDDALAASVRQTLTAGGLTEAVVRLTISRGISPARGLLPPAHPSPTLVVDAAPFEGYSADLSARGMRGIVSRILRNERSPLAQIKSLNYLENVLARQEAARQGADEALMLNTIGNLAGASAANLFVVRAGRIITPTRGCGALPGTVRQALLTGLSGQVIEQPLTVVDVATGDEAFLTNALLGVMPLTALDDHPIGTGLPGAVTRAVAALLT